ncbi:PH domain-containing protein [Limibacter armeniacum]|uniref:PH domain-containing protein n=1 Tax=Limibacter armeniacum TaxID=466084 RepID=UPI002FE56B95
MHITTALNTYKGYEEFLVIVILWTPILSIVGTVWLGTAYQITNDFMIIKIGPITHSVIPISEIHQINRSYSLMSSPALSLTRLEIKYSKSYILISPEAEEEFLTLIKSINPQILINITH